MDTPEPYSPQFIPPQTTQKPYWAGVILFVATALVVSLSVVYLMYGAEFSSSTFSSITVSLPKQNTKTDRSKTVLADNILPSNFPSDFPKESNVTVTSNYEQIMGNQIFGHREYQSNMYPIQNYSIFKTYFTEKGWIIHDSLYARSFEAQQFTAQKGNTVASLKMVNMDVKKIHGSTVIISFLSVK